MLQLFPKLSFDRFEGGHDAGDVVRILSLDFDDCGDDHRFLRQRGDEDAGRRLGRFPNQSSGPRWSGTCENREVRDPPLSPYFIVLPADSSSRTSWTLWASMGTYDFFPALSCLTTYS